MCLSFVRRKCISFGLDKIPSHVWSQFTAKWQDNLCQGGHLNEGRLLAEAVGMVMRAKLVKLYFGRQKMTISAIYVMLPQVAPLCSRCIMMSHVYDDITLLAWFLPNVAYSRMGWFALWKLVKHAQMRKHRWSWCWQDEILLFWWFIVYRTPRYRSMWDGNEK